MQVANLRLGVTYAVKVHVPTEQPGVTVTKVIQATAKSVIAHRAISHRGVETAKTFNQVVVSGPGGPYTVDPEDILDEADSYEETRLQRVKAREEREAADNLRKERCDRIFAVLSEAVGKTNPDDRALVAKSHDAHSISIYPEAYEALDRWLQNAVASRDAYYDSMDVVEDANRLVE